MKARYKTAAEWMADFTRETANRRSTGAGTSSQPIERKVLLNRDEAYAAAKRQLFARYGRVKP